MMERMYGTTSVTSVEIGAAKAEMIQGLRGVNAACRVCEVTGGGVRRAWSNEGISEVIVEVRG